VGSVALKGNHVIQFLLQHLITKIKESTPDRSEPSGSPYAHVTVIERLALKNLPSKDWAAKTRPVDTRGEYLLTLVDSMLLGYEQILLSLATAVY